MTHSQWIDSLGRMWDYTAIANAEVCFENGLAAVLKI
jgi:hypothetical protein